MTDSPREEPRKIRVRRRGRTGLVDRCDIPECRRIAFSDDGRGGSLRCVEHGDIGPQPTDTPPVELPAKYRGRGRPDVPRNPDVESMARILFTVQARGASWDGLKTHQRHFWRDRAETVLGMWKEVQ